MADKRMLDKNFLNEAQFMKLPANAKVLYVYAVVNADSDGFVVLYPLISQVKATEDEVKILEAKGFIVILDENWITFLPHWLQNQAMSFNRFSVSRYRNLLLTVRPDLVDKLYIVSEKQFHKVRQTLPLQQYLKRADVFSDSVGTMSVPIEEKRIEGNRIEFKKDIVLEGENFPEENLSQSESRLISDDRDSIDTLKKHVPIEDYKLLEKIEKRYHLITNYHMTHPQKMKLASYFNYIAPKKLAFNQERLGKPDLMSGLDKVSQPFAYLIQSLENLKKEQRAMAHETAKQNYDNVLN
ncbi:MAG: hypothetical protein L0F95_07160 [Lactococcus sp.]|nr:hypothetical protein [Lactococcus sp.]MDN5403430.1 hypothetical protein [Lactococcus sp.]MDN5410497.1 hypothetical protein [Lactococcus sp.]MDN5412178.1 hypothetical protein [Lactococcus sp.]MDN5436891.1 hypothetical protein [Lactococcus sp.]MDN5461979.1 hypothetical protein [Lactococcus sp.]